MIGYTGYTDAPEAIMEAITEYYKDDPDVVADCLVYLRIYGGSHMGRKAKDKIEDMNRCIDCGTPLEIMYYKDWHPEVGTFEEMADIYCPCCDIRHG